MAKIYALLNTQAKQKFSFYAIIRLMTLHKTYATSYEFEFSQMDNSKTNPKANSLQKKKIWASKLTSSITQQFVYREQSPKKCSSIFVVIIKYDISYHKTCSKNNSQEQLDKPSQVFFTLKKKTLSRGETKRFYMGATRIKIFLEKIYVKKYI